MKLQRTWHGSPVLIASVLSTALIMGQVGIMAVPAAIVELTREWALNASQVGWLGGIFFAGYATGLPFVSGAADRLDGRFVYVLAAALASLSSLGFGLLADGFWSAMALRFCAGIGFSGVHIVGLKLLADRLSGRNLERASAFYSAAYATGSSLSYVIVGLLGETWGWQSAFLAAAASAALALPLLLVVGPPLASSAPNGRRWLPNFTAAFRDRRIRRYVIAYAGNTWEVFAIRVWFVPMLTFSAAVNGEQTIGWSPPVLAGVSVIMAVPVSLGIAELGVRFGRAQAIRTVSLASVLVCLALGLLASGPYPVVLALLLLHGATSYGDAGAINSGIVAATRMGTRGAALALFGISGFVSGSLGSLAVGVAIDAAGGPQSPSSWFWAFAVMAAGSAVTALAVASRR